MEKKGLMEVGDVEAEVERIRAVAGDDEAAHGLEDELHVAVLRAIARGECVDPAGCSRVALKAGEIKFSRWYA